MNNKLIASCAGLVGYGALVGWALTADYYEAKMRSNQRLLGDMLERKTSELIVAKSMLMERDSTTSTNAGVGTPEVENDEVSGDEDETEEQVRERLQRQISSYTSDEASVEVFNELIEHVMVDEGPDNTPPFIIDKELHSWDPAEGDNFEKASVTYYPKHRVMVDDVTGEAIDNIDIDRIFGWANLDSFGDRSGHPDVVFIRNRRLQVDYEVVREEEQQLPAHILYGFDKSEFEAKQGSGVMRFRNGME